MSLLWIWFVAYAIPALLVGGLNKLLPRSTFGFSKRNTVITHAGLLISILLSQYFTYSLGFAFPFLTNLISFFGYVVTVAFAFWILGRLGGFYSLSVLFQQFAMLSISFLLLSSFPLYIVILLVAPLFVFCHELRTKYSLLRFLLISAWGVLSVLLFSILHDIWIVMALHIFAGAILIKRGVAYPELLRETN